MGRSLVDRFGGFGGCPPVLATGGRHLYLIIPLYKQKNINKQQKDKLKAPLGVWGLVKR